METLANNPAGVDGATGLAPARRDLYRFVSAAFLQAPTPEFLARLRDESFRDSLAGTFSPEVQGLFQACGVTGGGEADPAQAARREFMNLFKVPGGQYVTPYESVFRDTREINGREVSGLLLGQSALDVQQWYRLAALEISGDFKELPDHVGLEFHYLAYLCEKEREFEEAGDLAKRTRARQMQRDFLKAHLLSWLGDLAGKIRAKATLPLYPAIAGLALEFCQADLAMLESALGPSRGHPVPDYVN